MARPKESGLMMRIILIATVFSVGILMISLLLIHIVLILSMARAIPDIG